MGEGQGRREGLWELQGQRGGVEVCRGCVGGGGQGTYPQRPSTEMEMVPTACSLGFIQAGDGASLGSLFPPQAVPSGQG